MSANGIKEKIVADVTRLVNHCDDLEQQLADAKFTIRQLAAENERLKCQAENKEV